MRSNRLVFAYLQSLHVVLRAVAVYFLRNLHRRLANKHACFCAVCSIRWCAAGLVYTADLSRECPAVGVANYAPVHRRRGGESASRVPFFLDIWGWPDGFGFAYQIFHDSRNLLPRKI